MATTLNYFTGVRWGNSERMMLVVIPAKGEPFAVCPAFEEERLQERLSLVPAMAHTRLYTWQENESPYDRVAAGLKDASILSGQLGIERDDALCICLGTRPRDSRRNARQRSTYH